MLNEKEVRKKLKRAEEVLSTDKSDPQVLACVCILCIVLEETAEPELTRLEDANDQIIQNNLINEIRKIK